MMTAPEPGLYWAIAILLGAMCLGTVARFIALRNAEAETRQKRLASLRTWWLLALAVSAALLAGRLGICLLLGLASCVAWSEITILHRPRPEDRLAVLAGYVLIILNYLLILLGFTSWHGAFLPLCAMLLIAALLLVQDQPKDYIRATGALLWGLMFLGYGISHAALLLSLPMTANGPLGAAGWFLFLVILTESDDIFQAIVGRLFGAHQRHRIAPVISPNKTWEGFIGGMLVIVVMAPLLAPYLTGLGDIPGPLSVAEPLRPFVAPVMIALLISAAGFFGDINMSAIKRDAGVKDSSNRLPGMGGVIDRVDSLTMTAPVYVYFLHWWLG